MKKLIALLFLSPTLLFAQSLTSKGNEVIYVKPGTTISSANGFRLAGTGTNVLSIEQGNSPYNVAPYSRRVLVTNPNARLEIRNVGNTQIANYYMDVNYAATNVVADLSIQNSNATATYNVGLNQTAHTGFNDIPVEWTISKTSAAASDVHNIIFNWGNELEPTQIPVKRLFMFDSALGDWVQLSDANTSVDEFNNTLIFSGFEGALSNKRFMIAQAKSEVTLTGNMTPFEWCVGSASAVQSFSVEATNLTQALSVNAPANFEISLIPQGPFSSSITINPISFNVQPTVVYIRVAQAATAFGAFNVTASSTVVYYGSISDQLAVNSIELNPNVSITAPADMTVSANANCQAIIPSLGSPLANVDCGSVTVTNNAPATFPLGNTTVTWTATDANSGTATDTQIITVVDNTAPVIAGIPANITAGNTTGSCNATVTWTAPTATDNCAGVTLTTTHASGSVFALGTTTVTYTATDAAGNTSTASFTVTVNDTQNPTITAPAAVTVSANSSCNAFGVTLGTPTTADNCGVASVTNNAPGTFPIGATTVTWTVTDDAGNTATATQVVTVNDNTNPTIVAPANITVNANTNCQAVIANLGNAVVTDNCTVVTVTNNAPAAFVLGNTTVTWTATDAAGNTTTATQIVTVIDNTAPVIAGIPANITAGNTTGSCNATVTWTAPTATDNCAGVTLTTTHASGSVFALGTTTVTYTATDAAGNTSTASFTVTVNDTENPTITAPAAVTVSANSSCNAFGVTLGTPTTADNCGVASVTNNAPGTFPIGATTVTWTVTDDAGNTATATQVVTVNDNTNPTIVAPANITVNANTNCQAVIANLGNAVATDNCTVVTVTNNAPAAFVLGNTTVTWTATDAAGNTTTATQIVTVIDNTAPVIAGIPANITAGNTTGSCNATVTWTAPTATDNCAGVTLTTTHASGSVFALGTTTVTYTATDAAGNTSTASFTVTVNDTENPSIIAPTDVVFNANFGCQAIGVVLGVPSINDNCSISGVSNNAPPIYPLGNTTITWTISDNAGNMSTTTQLVTIVDNIAPSLTVPANLEVVSNSGCDAINVSFGQATATDNCGIQSIVNNAPAIFPAGTTQITWTATDNSGNQTSLIQLVTVVDLVAPTAVLTDLTIQLPVGSDALVTSAMIDGGSSDNCGGITFEITPNTFSCADLGENKVTVTITDDFGNSTIEEITVTVTNSGIDADFDAIDDACDNNINTTTATVPSGFTPDGDGINDLFVIPGMDNYTRIDLSIFNRYGNTVYSNDAYNNDWDGTSSINGNELPDGTYFYVLELDSTEILTGYVYINRVK